MLGNAHFRFGIIRKLVATFGSLFNDIDIVRYDVDDTPKERFKVPISFGAKEKYITRITSDPTLTKSVATVLPRMSFGLDAISYDASRKVQSTLMNFAVLNNSSAKTQYAPVPYNFEFSLSMYVRNIEDGTQILEQILPFFTPDFTVTIEYGGMDQKYDIPFILNSVNPPIEYEGDKAEQRFIVWDLAFTAKAYIMPPVKSGDIIRHSNVNIMTDETMNTDNTLVNIWTQPNPVTANANDTYTYTETITEYF